MFRESTFQITSLGRRQEVVVGAPPFAPVVASLLGLTLEHQYPSRCQGWSVVIRVGN